MNIDINPVIVCLAFFCELVDSSLGMGYGTMLAPILLMLGYPLNEVVPAVLLSEALTGLVAALCHHELGNANLRRGGRAFRVAAMTTGFGLVGVILAVALAVNLPAWAVKGYIGLLVMAVGIGILKNHRRRLPFSWRRTAGFGFLAAFNKGMSGGGYGPVVTGGLILSGTGSRSAIAIVSLAEGIISIAGVLAYWLLNSSITWQVAPSLLLGALLSAPAAAYVVSRVEARRLTFAVGSMATIIGAYTLAKMIL